MKEGENMLGQTQELTLQVRVTGQTQNSLTLAYRVENKSDCDVYIFNQIYKRRLPNGLFVVDPNLVYVSLGDDTLRLTKAVPYIPESAIEEHPIIPCATMLGHGQSFEETFDVILPAVSFNPYFPARIRDARQVPVTYHNTIFSLGYFKANELGKRQAISVMTSRGEAFYVTLTAPSQQLISSEPLIRPIPVLPELATQPPLLRTCPYCGGSNLGSLPICLLCKRNLGQIQEVTQPKPSIHPNIQPNVQPFIQPIQPNIQPSIQPSIAPALVTICPKCKQPLKPGKSFCTSCGYRTDMQSTPVANAPNIPNAPNVPTRVERICPNPQCRQVVRVGRRFCSICGTQVE